MREEGKKDKERLSCCLYDFYFYFPVFLRAGNGKCLPLYIKKLRAYEAKEHLKKNKAIAPPPPPSAAHGKEAKQDVCPGHLWEKRQNLPPHLQKYCLSQIAFLSFPPENVKRRDLSPVGIDGLVCAAALSGAVARLLGRCPGGWGGRTLGG